MEAPKPVQTRRAKQRKQPEKKETNVLPTSVRKGPQEASAQVQQEVPKTHGVTKRTEETLKQKVARPVLPHPF